MDPEFTPFGLEDSLAALGLKGDTADDPSFADPNAVPMLPPAQDPWAQPSEPQPELINPYAAPVPTPQGAPQSAAIQDPIPQLKMPEPQAPVAPNRRYPNTGDGRLQKAYDTADYRAQKDSYDTLQGYGTATNLKAEGLRDEARIQAEVAAQEAADLDELNKFTAASRQRLQEAHNEADKKAEAARLRYETSLAEFGAMKVNPGRLWSNMSGFDQVGIGATAFVDAFLGVKGIKSNAMQFFNEAVKNDINAQVTNIENAGKASDGFRQLWDMTVRDSGSKVEAMAKMEGYYIEDFKRGLSAHMSKFKGPLANAQLKKSLGDLSESLLDTKLKVTQFNDQRANQEKQMALQRYHQDQQTGIAYAQMAERRKEREAAERAAQADAIAKAREKRKGKLIASPFGDGTRAVFREGIKDTEEAEVRKVGTAMATLDREVQEYKDALIAYGKQKNLGPLSSAARAELNGKRENIILKLGKEISGASVSPQQLSGIQTMIPTWETFVTDGEEKLKRNIADAMRRKQNEYVDYLDQYAVPLDPSDPDYTAVSPKHTVGEARRADVKGQYNTAKDGVQDTEVDTAKKGLSTPDRNKPVSNEDSLRVTQAAGGKVVPWVDDFDRWRTTRNSDPDNFVKGSLPAVPPTKEDIREGAYLEVGLTDNPTPPKWAADISVLNQAALNGDGDALTALEDIAARNKTATKMLGNYTSGPASGYAYYLLRQNKNLYPQKNPDGSKRAIAARDLPTSEAPPEIPQELILKPSDAPE